MTTSQSLRFTILLLTFTAIFAGYPYAEEDSIINLGEPTFGIATDEFHEGLFVYFYEPFCTPCREMWQDLKKAAATLKGTSSRAKIAKVECHDEVKLCDARGVNTFPTLLLHRKGRATIEYRGVRTAQGITEWIQKAVDQKYPDLTENDLYKFFNTALIVKSANHALSEAYKDLIDYVEVTTDKNLGSLSSKIGQNAGALVSSNGFWQPIDGSMSQASIVDALNKAMVNGPPIPNFNEGVSNGLQNNVVGEFIFFFRTSKFDFQSSQNKAFEDVSSTLRGLDQPKPHYVNVYNDILGATLGKMFGITEDSDAAVGLLRKNNNVYEKYLLDGSITKDSISTLVKQVKAGTAKRFYVTGPPVEHIVTAKSPMKKYVRPLVGSQYREVGSDGAKEIFDKYVFVHFYFPWCEWCVKLEPTWNALAYRMRHYKNVVIAKTDVSENDIQGFDMSEFPVLVLFTPNKTGENNKNYVIHYGKRDISSLLNVLFENVEGLKDEYEM